MSAYQMEMCFALKSISIHIAIYGRKDRILIPSCGGAKTWRRFALEIILEAPRKVDDKLDVLAPSGSYGAAAWRRCYPQLLRRWGDAKVMLVK